MNVLFIILIKRFRNFCDINRKNYDIKEIIMLRISIVKVKDYVKKIGEM